MSTNFKEDLLFNFLLKETVFFVFLLFSFNKKCFFFLFRSLPERFYPGCSLECVQTWLYKTKYLILRIACSKTNTLLFWIFSQYSLIPRSQPSLSSRTDQHRFMHFNFISKVIIRNCSVLISSTNSLHSLSYHWLIMSQKHSPDVKIVKSNFKTRILVLYILGSS